MGIGERAVEKERNFGKGRNVVSEGEGQGKGKEVDKEGGTVGVKENRWVLKEQAEEGSC